MRTGRQTALAHINYPRVARVYACIYASSHTRAHGERRKMSLGVARYPTAAYDLFATLSLENKHKRATGWKKMNPIGVHLGTP